MRLETIVAELQRLKGSGAWERISKAGGIDYNTLTRIARGVIKDPGVLTCERIAAAIEAERPKSQTV